MKTSGPAAPRRTGRNLMKLRFHRASPPRRTSRNLMKLRFHRARAYWNCGFTASCHGLPMSHSSREMLPASEAPYGDRPVPMNGPRFLPAGNLLAMRSLPRPDRV
jgi:hypothetical protein